MKVFQAIVLSLFILFILAALLLMGVSKEEKVTCNNLQSQAKEFPAFFLTQWQKDMCDAHSITIDAPVQTLENNNQ